MGEAFGESCRDEIAALYALRLENALGTARADGGRECSEAELLALAGRCLAATAGNARDTRRRPASARPCAWSG
jgi:hypothetical protein